MKGHVAGADKLIAAAKRIEDVARRGEHVTLPSRRTIVDASWSVEAAAATKSRAQLAGSSQMDGGSARRGSFLTGAQRHRAEPPGQLQDTPGLAQYTVAEIYQG